MSWDKGTGEPGTTRRSSYLWAGNQTLLSVGRQPFEPFGFHPTSGRSRKMSTMPARRRTLHGVRTGDHLNHLRLDPLRWIVPGIIPEGISLLVGPPKIGKSWVALGIALAVAGGTTALGLIDLGEPRPVLMFALEDSERRLQDRAQALLEGENIPSTFTYATSCPPDQIIPKALNWPGSLGTPGLIVSDVLAKAMTGKDKGEPLYERDYRFMGQLRTLIQDRQGVGVLAVHHTRKQSAEDFVEASSGTNGITGSADTVLNLSRVRNSAKGVLKVTGRDVQEGSTPWTLHRAGFSPVTPWTTQPRPWPRGAARPAPGSLATSRSEQ
jgi:hypothetical protein